MALRRARRLVGGALVAACLAVLGPGAAAAVEPPPARHGTGGEGPSAAPARLAAPSFTARAALAVTHFTYEERADDGALLDRERGVVPGALVGASWRPGAWELAAELGYARAAVAYDGRTNTGIPITTRTDEEVRTAALHVRRWLALAGKPLAPHAGLGYRRWGRAIRPTRTASGTPVHGLVETYTWWTAEAGLEVIVASAKRLRASLEGRVFRTLGANVEVEFATGLDDVRLALGDATGYRVGASGAYAVTPSTELRVDLHREAWGFGRSPDAELTRDGVRSGTVHEPRSETRNLGLSVGVASRF